MSRFERLLRPKSVAVIGGGAWCQSVIDNNRAFGFQGQIWPVHATKKMISGIPAFTSVSELPEAPDAAFVGVNRIKTIDIVAELSALGCGGVVCFASGFREADTDGYDAAALQERLLAASGDMPLIGPNCYGFINYLDGAALWPDQHGGKRVERGVAILTQSSNMAINITAQRRGLPIAYIVTIGNQAQTSLAELALALLNDTRVTALGLHIEGFSDLPTYARLAHEARKLNKGLVAMKIGRSSLSRQATLTHTASMAGGDAGASALLERLGIARVNSLPVMLETLKILHIYGPLSGNRIASVSCSGGEAALISDTAEGYDLNFPALNDKQTKHLGALLGPKVTLANPLDYHTYIWGDEDAITQVLQAITDPGLTLVIIILDFPARGLDDEAWLMVARAAEKANRGGDTRFAIAATLHENLPADYAENMTQRGLLTLFGLDEAVAAIEAAYKASVPLSDEPAILCPPAEPQKSCSESLNGIANNAVEPPAKPVMLSEAEGKTLLASYGVNIPPHQRTETPDQAANAAEELGFPVVVKGEGLAHKSEAGAVVVGLHQAEAVEQAARRMPAKTYLVEAMIEGGCAELLIGIVCDPAHGFVLTLGAGGILTELIDDRQSLLIPTTRQSVAKALERLKVNRLLKGFRGRPVVNCEAVIDQVMAIQAFVMDHHERLVELEINPLIVTETRAFVVDVLIVKHV